MGNAGPILVWLVSLGLIGIVYVRLSRHALDPVALFCYLFAFFYLFRQTVVTLGLDGPYPDYLFAPSQLDEQLVTAGLAISLFLASFLAGYVLYERLAPVAVSFAPVTWSVPPIRRQVRLVTALTAVATVISVALLARYGGVHGLIRAGKVTGSLAGSFELRIFPSIGAVVASALTLALWQQRRDVAPRPLLLAFAFAAAVLNAGFVLLWGSRQAAAIVLLILIAGRWLLRDADARNVDAVVMARRRRAMTFRLIAVAAILVVAVTGLRLIRDTVAIGHANSSIQGQTTVRTLSVATNATYFDAVLLGVRDWPSTYPYRNGKDFVIGVEGVIPRFLWPGKPASVTPGSWFRQTYEPGHINGWPLGAVGDWYLNFGFVGLLIGGVLSGAVFSVLMKTWWRVPWSPFTIASILTVVVFVVPTGVDALTPLRWVQWALPLLICARYLDGPRTKRSADMRMSVAAPNRLPT